MRHETFLRNLLIGIAASLGTLNFIIMTSFNPLTLIATSALTLVLSLTAIYFFAAGGYHITQSHIEEAVRGMRG